jgi:hypothetical protein
MIRGCCIVLGSLRITAASRPGRRRERRPDTDSAAPAGSVASRSASSPNAIMEVHTVAPSLPSARSLAVLKGLPLALVRACGMSCNRPVTKQRIMALPSRIAAETG